MYNDIHTDNAQVCDINLTFFRTANVVTLKGKSLCRGFLEYVDIQVQIFS